MARLHPRELPVKAAQTALTKHLLEWSEVHELTTLEALSVVSAVMGGYCSSLIKYGLRKERHGNVDTPAGWAKEDEDDGQVRDASV